MKIKLKQVGLSAVMVVGLGLSWGGFLKNDIGIMNPGMVNAYADTDNAPGYAFYKDDNSDNSDDVDNDGIITYHSIENNDTRY